MVIPNKFFAAKWITAKVHGEPAIVSKDEILKILVLIICKEFSVLWTKMLWKTSCGRSWSSLAFILNSNEPARSLWFSHDPKASGYPHIAFWGHPILSWNYMIWIVIRPSKPRPSRMTFNFCLAFIFNNYGLTWSLCVPYYPKGSGCPHTASWGHLIWPKLASSRSWSVFQEKIKT